jgi:hypothetical protein
LAEVGSQHSIASQGRAISNKLGTTALRGVAQASVHAASALGACAPDRGAAHRRTTSERKRCPTALQPHGGDQKACVVVLIEPALGFELGRMFRRADGSIPPRDRGEAIEIQRSCVQAHAARLRYRCAHVPRGRIRERMFARSSTCRMPDSATAVRGVSAEVDVALEPT